VDELKARIAELEAQVAGVASATASDAATVPPATDGDSELKVCKKKRNNLDVIHYFLSGP
jgi:hypothetical protein